MCSDTLPGILLLIEISVVVTNYNYGRYLSRCLRSLLAQDIDKELYEIVLVDDGSTDESLKIANRFEKQIKIFRNITNKGLSNASNLGIDKSCGRFIVRVDSDDFVHSSFLRILLLGFELLGRNFHALSVDYQKVDELGNVLSYGNAELEPIACGLAFKSDALMALGFYNNNLRINEEVDLRRRFMEANFEVKHIKLPLDRYVQHDQSLTKQVLN